MATNTYQSMFEHPAVRIALQVLAIYMGLTILHRWSPLDVLAVLCAALVAAGVWILEHRSDLAARVSASAIGRKWLECVADMSGQSLQGVSPAATPRTQLVTDRDFATAANTIKEQVQGHDGPIEKTLEQIRRAFRVREEGSAAGPQGPMASFLYVGASGTGKRLTATAIGAAIFGRPLVATLDASVGAVCSNALRATASQYPSLCLVIENVDRASRTFVNDLIAVLSGAPLHDNETGHTLDMSGWILFLLVHKNAESLPDAGAAGNHGSNGATILASQLQCDYGLEPAIVWHVNESLPFLMPGESEQAKAVLCAFQEECRVHGVRLSHVAPEIIAREVQETRSKGNFEVLPGRVRHRLRAPIYKALSQGDSSIVL